jgi:hypothetical protein
MAQRRARRYPGSRRGGDEDQLPPGTQTPEPPVQPTSPGDDAGAFGGMGQRYVDVMPALVQDPTTGEWRVLVQDPTTGEWRPPEPAESPNPNILPDLLAPSAPGPTLDSDLLDPNAPGPTVDPSLLDPNSAGPTLDPALLDPSARGPTIEPALFDTGMRLNWVHPSSPALIPGHPDYDPDAVPYDPMAPSLNHIWDRYHGPGADPGRRGDESFDPSASGPTIEPALLDPNAPGPTIDPALLDPNSAGPTIEPALLDPTAPGPTLHPNQLDPSAPGPTLDPAQLEQGIAEPPSGGVAEPLAGVTDRQGFTDPFLTESGHPEPSRPGQDLDDPSALG